MNGEMLLISITHTIYLIYLQFSLVCFTLLSLSQCWCTLRCLSGTVNNAPGSFYIHESALFSIRLLRHHVLLWISCLLVVSRKQTKSKEMCSERSAPGWIQTSILLLYHIQTHFERAKTSFLTFWGQTSLNVASDKSTTTKLFLYTICNTVGIMFDLQLSSFIRLNNRPSRQRFTHKHKQYVGLYCGQQSYWNYYIIICSMTNSYDLLSDLERTHWGALFGF